MSDVEKYVYDLIAEGEHVRQDFKFEITSARKIARTLVAFANTEGGRLLIGVKDNGNISGIRSEEEFYMIDAAATMYCKPEIAFESFQRDVEGKTILEVLVKPSDRRPHYALDEKDKWLAYQRVRDENILADPILLQVWKREKRTKGTFLRYTENETKLLNYLKQHECATFGELKAHMKLKNPVLKSILVNLVALQVVRMDYPGNELCFRASEEQPGDEDK